jgi:hypothetical protein
MTSQKGVGNETYPCRSCPISSEYLETIAAGQLGMNISMWYSGGCSTNEKILEAPCRRRFTTEWTNSPGGSFDQVLLDSLANYLKKQN